MNKTQCRKANIENRMFLRFFDEQINFNEKTRVYLCWLYNGITYNSDLRNWYKCFHVDI